MQWWQILLLTLYSFYQICDELILFHLLVHQFLLVS